jgi:hypothetical protein
MSLNKLFKTDSDKQREGIWLEISENANGTICRMKIRPMGASNKEFVTKATSIRKKYSHRLKSMGNEKQNELAMEAFIGTVLIDWENVEDYRIKVAEGQKAPLMEFNEENAKFLLKDLPQLYELISAESTDIENFIQKDIEEDLKN